MEETRVRPYRAAPQTPLTEAVIETIVRYVRLVSRQRVEAIELAERHERERVALAYEHGAQIIDLAHQLGALAELRLRPLERAARGHRRNQAAPPEQDEAA